MLIELLLWARLCCHLCMCSSVQGKQFQPLGCHILIKGKDDLLIDTDSHTYQGPAHAYSHVCLCMHVWKPEVGFPVSYCYSTLLFLMQGLSLEHKEQLI